MGCAGIAAQSRTPSTPAEPQRAGPLGVADGDGSREREHGRADRRAPKPGRRTVLWFGVRFSLDGSVRSRRGDCYKLARRLSRGSLTSFVVVSKPLADGPSCSVER